MEPHYWLSRLHSKFLKLLQVGYVNGSIAELTSVVAKERTLLDQCRDFLSTAAALQVKCHIEIHSFSFGNLRQGKKGWRKKKEKREQEQGFLFHCYTKCTKSGVGNVHPPRSSVYLTQLNLTLWWTGDGAELEISRFTAKLRTCKLCSKITGDLFLSYIYLALR